MHKVEINVIIFDIRSCGRVCVVYKHSAVYIWLVFAVDVFDCQSKCDTEQHTKRLIVRLLLMATTLNSEIFDRSHSRRAPYVRTLLTFLFQLFLYVLVAFFFLSFVFVIIIRVLDVAVDFRSEGGKGITSRPFIACITRPSMKNKTFQNRPIHRSIHFTR